MTARKLTLLIDEALIERAKRIARIRGQSVSLLVSEQFSQLAAGAEKRCDPFFEALHAELLKQDRVVEEHAVAVLRSRHATEKYL